MLRRPEPPLPLRLRGQSHIFQMWRRPVGRSVGRSGSIRFQADRPSLPPSLPPGNFGSFRNPPGFGNRSTPSPPRACFDRPARFGVLGPAARSGQQPGRTNFTSFVRSSRTSRSSLRPLPVPGGGPPGQTACRYGRSPSLRPSAELLRFVADVLVGSWLGKRAIGLRSVAFRSLPPTAPRLPRSAVLFRPRPVEKPVRIVLGARAPVPGRGTARPEGRAAGAIRRTTFSERGSRRRRRR